MKSAAWPATTRSVDRVRKSERAAGVSLIVFNDLVTACTWLGVDKSAAQATVTELAKSSE